MNTLVAAALGAAWLFLSPTAVAAADPDPATDPDPAVAADPSVPPPPTDETVDEPPSTEALVPFEEVTDFGRTLDPAFDATCGVDPLGRRVRLQCLTSDRGRACIYAVDCEAADSACRPPERVRPCSALDPADPTGFWDRRAAEGFRFVRVRHDTPPGWYRDDEGRVFQVDFDLNDRFYLGARWLTRVDDAGHANLGGASFETGLRLEFLDGDLSHRLRLYALETDVTLSPFTFRGTALRIDTSNQGQEPLLRITTFWGEPTRHDIYADLGFWLEAGTFELEPRALEDHSVLRIVGLGATWDLWHAADLSSFLRLRLGAAVDDLFTAARGDAEAKAELALTPLAWLEADVTVDRGGHHHLQFGAGVEELVIFRQHTDKDVDYATRFRAEAAWEFIVLALNDQPLTLRLAASGGYRDDLPAPAQGWDLAAGLGLRVNLIAPPRDLDALDRAEVLRAKERRGARP